MHDTQITTHVAWADSGLLLQWHECLIFQLAPQHDCIISNCAQCISLGRMVPCFLCFYGWEVGLLHAGHCMWYIKASSKGGTSGDRQITGTDQQPPVRAYGHNLPRTRASFTGEPPFIQSIHSDLRFCSRGTIPLHCLTMRATFR
jgi:hypothetical protein